MAAARTVRVTEEFEIATAARAARDLAKACGLSGVEAQYVATAVSEVARNAVTYAGGGEVVLVPDRRRGRAGLRITVRDRGPGIADLDAALLDGVSTGGSLGLGLPGARRLMDEFEIRTGPGGTEVRMGRWEGGLLAGSAPAVCSVAEGVGGVGLVQPFRNGLLVGMAAGAHADDVTRAWRTRPWHTPAQLAQDACTVLDHGERLGVAVASVSGLDGRLAWMRAGAVGCVLLRGEAALLPPAGTALSRRGGGPPRAATIDVRRDDVLVLAALPLAPAALAELAARADDPALSPGTPAFVSARFERGALEPRRPHGSARRADDEGA